MTTTITAGTVRAGHVLSDGRTVRNTRRSATDSTLVLIVTTTLDVIDRYADELVSVTA